MNMCRLADGQRNTCRGDKRVKATIHHCQTERWGSEEQIWLWNGRDVLKKWVCLASLSWWQKREEDGREGWHMAVELDWEVKMEKRVKEETGAEFSHLGSVSRYYLILKNLGIWHENVLLRQLCLNEQHFKRENSWVMTADYASFNGRLPFYTV